MTTTATEKVDYTQYQDKKVVLTVKDDKDPEAVKELEGTITTATPVGILFKARGRATADLILPDQIVAVELAPDNRKVTVKYIKPVQLGQVRTHLADRHGFLLSMLNTITEEEAVLIHDKQHA